MNKWMYVSLCGMILLAASGCSGKEASPAASSPAAASATPSPVATATAAATPTIQVSATVTPAATAAPAATASPAAAASATPQPQASATPSPKPAPTAAPASATPAATPAPSVKPQETTVSSSSAKAELLYKDNCLVCHGVGLTGDYGPNLTKVGSRRTKEQIVTQIMNGKVEMPPFKDKLKSEDIEVLANWLSSMK